MLSIQPNRTQIEPIIKQRLVFIVLFTVSSIMVQAQDDCGSCVKGNLTSRQGVHGTEQENFTYDNHDRLTEVYTTTGAGDIETEYDTNGNISYKTDIGSYLYDTQQGQPVMDEEALSDETVSISVSPNPTSGPFTLVVHGMEQPGTFPVTITDAYGTPLVNAMGSSVATPLDISAKQQSNI